MSTHNIGFYEDLTKISFNYNQIRTLSLLLDHTYMHKLMIILFDRVEEEVIWSSCHIKFGS